MNYFLFEKGEVPCKYEFGFVRPRDENPPTEFISENFLHINLKYFNTQTTLQLSRSDMLILKDMYKNGVMSSRYTIMHMIDVCRNKMREDGMLPPVKDVQKYQDEIYKRVVEASEQLDKFIEEV